MLHNQRDKFSLPEGVHYLNCASRAPLLKTTEAVGIRGLRNQEYPVAAAPEDYFAEPEALRAAISRLVNCEANDVALTPSVSYGVAIAAHNVQLTSAHNIVFVEEEFPSNVYAWLELAKSTGATIKQVPRAASASDWNTRLLEAIDGNTAVVSLSSVHWTDGTRFDLDAVGTRCREMGALFVLDGTQSIGAQPLDFQQVQPDLLVGAAYKWIFGPYQLGYAVVGERLRNGKPFENHWSTRAGSQDTSNTAYHPDYFPGARRFDVGEQGNPISVPMLTNSLAQLQEWGVDAVSAYCASLADHLAAGLYEQHFSLPSSTDRYSHILGIRAHDPAHIQPALDAMAERRISISRRGNVLRVSPNVYNTTDDIDAVLDALQSVAA